MSPLDLAYEYMRIFHSGAGYDALHSIFAEDMTFDGPLYSFNSAANYINSLMESPCVGCRYSMVEAFERENRAVLIYEFSKGDLSTLMTQIFDVLDGEISKIRLVFDSRVFAAPG